MQSTRCVTRGGFLVILAGALATAGLLVGAISAQQPPAGKAPAESAPTKEKRLAFEMREKPWAQVFEWLADNTGLPVAGQYKPTGTFTFISPRGPDGQVRKYTIPEIIDIINETLLAGPETQQYVLIRRQQTFALVPANEKIRPEMLQKIAVEDLPNRGKTEIVSVMLHLKTLSAENLQPAVKKMMGPFGDAVAIEEANQLYMQDSVANLERIVATIKDIEKNDQAQTYTHQCKYIKARDAEQVLKSLLGDAREQALFMSRQQPQPSVVVGFPFGGADMMGGDTGFGPGGRGPGGKGPRMQMPSGGTTTTKLPRMHYVTSDERTQTVLVSGPADIIAKARAVMDKLDVAEPGQQPLLKGAPYVQTYPVPDGNAETISKNLQEIHKGTSSLRIAAVGQSSIMVYATPEDHFDIAKQIQGTRMKNGAAELIPLNELDATTVAKTLTGMFADKQTGAPYIEADTTRNAIIVKGTSDQVSEVKSVLRAMGEGVGALTPTGNMRVISLDKGSAATLAEALQRMLPQMRKNIKVNVVNPNEETQPKIPVQPKEPKEPGQSKDKVPLRETSLNRDRNGNLQFVSQQLADPQQQKKDEKQAGDNKGGKGEKSVNISAFGNKLIVTSDDPESLKLVTELVRLLTQTQSGEGDFQIIPLKNANAVQAAQVLDELFNGPKEKTPQQQGFGRGGFGGFGGGGFGGGGFGGRGGFGPGGPFNAQAATTVNEPRKDRIRVVADPGTNSLLVRATPLDLLTIRGILDRAIDTGNSESRAVMKTHKIGPLKFARAVDVAQVVREVYRESINNNPVTTTVGGFPGFGFFGTQMRGSSNIQNVDANGNPIGVTLSIGVDDQTNMMIVLCSQKMFEDIDALAKELDKAAGESNRTVKVMSIKNVDPVLVQQAIDAIQGRRSTTNGRPGSTPGFVPSGTGGFITPGGGGGFGGGGGGFGGGGGGRGMGGGGGRGGGGGGRFGGGTSMLDNPRGPDFFAPRVMDDPESSVLFDPQRDVIIEDAQSESGARATEAQSPFRTSESGTTQLVSHEEQQQPPAQAAPDSGNVKAPRSPVQAEALEQLGVIVISGSNAADVEEVVRIIEYIQRLGAGADVTVRMVPLYQADAVSVSNTLTQLYQRVLVGATSTSISAARPGTTPGATPGPTTQPTLPGQAPTTPGLGTAAGAAQQQNASVVLLPLPRHNAIFVAAPKARVEEIVEKISGLDRPVSALTKGTPFALHRASARQLAAQLTTFYASRYPLETQLQNEIRFTYDDGSNTLFVQAAPADLAEIRDYINWVENNVSRATNELRLVTLKNAVSDDMATLLQRTITEGTVTPSPAAGPVFPAGPTAGVPNAPLTPAALAAQAANRPAGTGAATKTTTLRFFSSRRVSPNVYEAGVLEDIYITSDPRTNTLILSAPEKTMKLILAVIADLDVPPAAQANINIFSLKKADAGTVASMLQQLFTGSGAAAAAAKPGFPAAPTATTTGAPLSISLGGYTPEGAPLIPLRVTIDDKTNSLIVAGSRNDLDVVQAIIARIDDTTIFDRRNEVYQLHYAFAADIATALTTFLPQQLAVYSKVSPLTNFIELQRDVIVVPEPITNSLLISASVKYFDDVMQIIAKLDAQPAQVVIQCLVAEVDLTGTEEFGVEMGVQSPVLFNRSVFPILPQFGSGTTTFTPSTSALAGTSGFSAVSISNTVNPYGVPGLNFNSPGIPLGNNPSVSPGVVGYQGLSSLGVGRVSPISGIGGFVFSAQSDAFNLLVRALATQGRMDILTRPQVTTTDNQQATILIGSYFPYTTGTTTTVTTAVPAATSTVNYRNIGIQLQVTPKIEPDGSVIMRVTPEISKVGTTVSLGNGQTAPSFDVQTVDTTVIAMDGETVVIGGLIQKSVNKTENRVPWLGELPVVGALFRFRTEIKSKTELLVILTPHVVRSIADRERILAMEAKRMDWVVGDVLKIQGTSGMEPILPPPPVGNGHHGPPPAPVLELGPMQVPAPPQPLPGEALPPPRPVAPGPQGLSPNAPPAAPVAAERGAQIRPVLTEPK